MTRFYRSTKDKTIGGICGALGEIYNIDANVIRIITVLAFLITGFFPIGVVYLAAWVILPEDVQVENKV